MAKTEMAKYSPAEIASAIAVYDDCHSYSVASKRTGISTNTLKWCRAVN